MNKFIKFATLVIIAFLSFRFNFFKVVDEGIFQNFQNDSENLVIAKIIAEKYNLEPDRKGFYLGRISETLDFVWQYLFAEKCNGIIILPNKKINQLKINNKKWNNGISQNGMYILLPDKNIADHLQLYIGNNIVIDDIVRNIKEIGHDGEYYYIVLDKKIEIDNISNIDVTGGLFNNIKGIKWRSYKSQVGIQGKIFSLLYKNYRNISSLYTINCWLLALCLVFICCRYSNIISNSFSFCLYLSLILSPWLVAFARNLYWIPFSWFLPAALSLYLININKERPLYIAFVIITCTFCFKCLCGYEYISSIILFAASPFLYKAITNKKNKKYHIKCFFIICMAGLCGFAIAFLYHANLRGDTIIQGIQHIYEQDITRRTYGDASKFADVYNNSLTASIWVVIKRYIYGWHTEVLPCIAGKYFPLFIYLGIISLFFTLKARFGLEKEKLSAFIIYMLPAMSWYILGKAHSYIHMHMNFVLWYFGFIAVVMYCILDGIKLFICAQCTEK